MTKEELLAALEACSQESKGDREAAHSNADYALLDFINDPEILAAYESFGKWYA